MLLDPARTNVVLTYRNFAGHQGISHRGLSIAAANNNKVLLQNGINSRVEALASVKDFNRLLQNDPSITHVVISALWLPSYSIAALADQYPRTHFIVVSHSNVGFLQTDPGAIRMIRETMEMESVRWNVHVAGNSKAFCEWIIKGYGAPCTYLPNMYYTDSTVGVATPTWSASSGRLRVGLFGASRWQKNFITQVAAVTIAAHCAKVDTELLVNTGRRDGPEATRIYDAAVAMTQGIPYVKLTTIPWAPWPNFRTYIKTCNVLTQNSVSESFNMVVADGVAMGVPAAVSPAIDWTPSDWQVECDDADLLATKILALASDASAPARGLKALRAHNSEGLDFWLNLVLNGRYGVGGDLWAQPGTPKNYIVGNQSLGV